jgi:hypothetical protein
MRNDTTSLKSVYPFVWGELRVVSPVAYDVALLDMGYSETMRQTDPDWSERVSFDVFARSV